eukprot:4933734-Karenia_brevis.AAC.1
MNQAGLDSWETFRTELVEVRRVQAAAGGSAPMDFRARRRRQGWWKRNVPNMQETGSYGEGLLSSRQ